MRWSAIYLIRRARRALSLMMLVMGVVPMFARLVGGQIFAVFGWHAIFWLLTGFGVICLLVVLLRLPESNPPDRRIRGRKPHPAGSRTGA